MPPVSESYKKEEDCPGSLLAGYFTERWLQIALTLILFVVWLNALI